ncbi:acetate uptake transporter [Flexibacterium corallicola]|uniref:acetate uptake transporter n=1 Tax=Flexibacterium corallicola TaxID=3037259 RepID=UPI00286EF03F|nr:acetate uptake transporter [Pseudovibrio sp. M1P-2-3]
MQSETSDPGAVGFAGFGMTTFTLQMQNIGLLEGTGPIIWLGFFVGGLAQFIAGLQAFKSGNNFGYSAFTIYGVFWLAFCGLLTGNELGFFESTPADMGWFTVPFAIYSAILMYAALHNTLQDAITSISLNIGLALSLLGSFVDPAFMVASGYALTITSLSALYSFAAIIYKEALGREVLPKGQPLLCASKPMPPKLKSVA